LIANTPAAAISSSAVKRLDYLGVFGGRLECRAGLWLDRANKGVVTFSTGLPMYNWPLNDAHLVLLILFCLAVITIGSIVGALTRSRAAFARLHNEVTQLSEEIKALQVAEQRRFLMELKSNIEAKEPLAANATKLSPISESHPLGASY
jgi:hypothetical protein